MQKADNCLIHLVLLGFLAFNKLLTTGPASWLLLANFTSDAKVSCDGSA